MSTLSFSFSFFFFPTIFQILAVDMDKGENGEVRYELIKGHGELFKVCRKSGEVTLKQSLEGHNREYELIIAAYDGGLLKYFVLNILCSERKEFCFPTEQQKLYFPFQV